MHDGTLGDRNFPEYPVPQIDQSDGQLRTRYVPFDGARTDGVYGNPVAYSDYTISMPFNVFVNINNANGSRTGLWMISSPVTSGTCRNFTYMSRTPFSDPDELHIAFDAKVYAEDLPVIESQLPREIPSPKQEIAITQDKLLIFYRRWLKAMSKGAEQSPDALKQAWLKERWETK